MAAGTEFSDIEARAQTLLKADAYFDEISVLKASDGSVEQNVGQRLGLISGGNPGGKLGLLVLCRVPGANGLALHKEKLRVAGLFVAAVLENPLVNNTTGRKRAVDVAGQVLRVLNLQPIDAAVNARVAVQRFVPAEPPIAQVLDDQGALYGISGATVYHVNWAVQVNL